MSEYQFIHFQALDGPLGDEQLAFMRQQSSRADVSRWEFTNEYHFGDFHGDARAMLRNGYDVHLHFANFGIRRLMFRLPAGLPCDRKTFEAYRAAGGVAWHADTNGTGGILEICPEVDADCYDAYLDDVHAMLDRIAPVRAGLFGGDVRALYLAWLACRPDDDAREPRVPAGLAEILAAPKPAEDRSAGASAGTAASDALAAMAEFYELGDDLLAAAAERSPPLPEGRRPNEALQAWVGRQSKDALRSLVLRLMDDHAATRADVLVQVRGGPDAPAWPMAEPSRTLGQLREAVGRVEQGRLRRQERARRAARKKRLAAIAANPGQVLATVKTLVAERSTHSYEQVARELADLREALGPEQGPTRARAIARKLHAENPRRHFLTAALRDQGLLD